MHYDVSRTSLGNRQHGTGTATAFTALRVPALSNATLGRFRRLLEEHLHGMDDWTNRRSQGLLVFGSC